jgi:hypothetical protein
MGYIKVVGGRAHIVQHQLKPTSPETSLTLSLVIHRVRCVSLMAYREPPGLSMVIVFNVDADAVDDG